MWMTIKDMIRFTVLRAPDDETGSGGESSTGGEGGDAPAVGGEADTKGADTSVAVGGGTAEGEDNSNGEGDSDKSGDDTTSGEGDDTAEGGDKDDEAEGGEGEEDTSEAYDEFTLPEGIDNVDEQMLEAVSPVMKELGLTQDQAQKMVDAYADIVLKQAEANADAFNKITEGWRETAQADKEIGGDNWDTSVATANAAVREFGDEELVKDILVGQKLGNHPAMIRFMNRVGKHILDDEVITGEQTDTSDEVSPEAAFYGQTTPEKKKG